MSKGKEDEVIDCLPPCTVMVRRLCVTLREYLLNNEEHKIIAPFVLYVCVFMYSLTYYKCVLVCHA